MPLARVLLSAVTLFGGHFLNRRLDRVVIVVAMLGAVAVLSFMVVPSLLFRLVGEPALEYIFHGPRVLLALTVVTSAALTWLDARKPPGPTLSIGMQLAGVLVSLVGLAIVANTALSFGTVHERSSAVRVDADSDMSIRYNMYTAIHLGGHASDRDPPKPPLGKHDLRGRVMFDGRPVSDAFVEVTLNEAFETEALTTDAQGYFHVRLPAGEWRVNRVAITGWKHKPEDRELYLFSEFDAMLAQGEYSRHLSTREAAWRVKLPSDAANQPPTFELRDAVDVRWPTRTSLIGAEPAKSLPIAKLESSVIEWTAVPDAAQYQVQLQRVEREEHSMSVHSLLRRQQTGTSLALASLPQTTAAPDDKREYMVEIYAFDKDGKLLSQTGQRSGEYAFALSGSAQLAEEHSNPMHSGVKSGEYFKNLERLSLVSGLLEYKQLDAARAILKEVTDDAPAGRKVGLEASIAALEGRCAEALPLFDKADAEGGIGCAPPKYRKLCER